MSTDWAFLEQLFATIHGRRGHDKDVSYVAYLYHKGAKHIAQKVGEEGVETALAGAAGEPQELIDESADLLFHLMVLLAERNVTLEEVIDELKRREGIKRSEQKDRTDGGA